MTPLNEDLLTRAFQDIFVGSPTFSLNGFFLPQALHLIQTLKNQAIEVGRRPGQHMQKKSSKKECRV